MLKVEDIDWDTHAPQASQPDHSNARIFLSSNKLMVNRPSTIGPAPVEFLDSVNLEFRAPDLVKEQRDSGGSVGSADELNGGTIVKSLKHLESRINEHPIPSSPSSVRDTEENIASNYKDGDRDMRV